MPTVPIPDALKARINAGSVSFNGIRYQLRFVSANTSSLPGAAGCEPGGSIVEIATAIGDGENPQVAILAVTPSRLGDHDTIVSWLQHLALETISGRWKPGAIAHL